MEHSLRVLENRWFGSGVFELVTSRDGISFVPGECLSLYAADQETHRPYAIASGVDEACLRFVVRSVQGGTTTGHLSRLCPGDTVRCSAPFGTFRPGAVPAGAPFVFVATGTGIAPFLSYLRSTPDRPPAQLLYGVRYSADAAELLLLRSKTRLSLAVSREDVSIADGSRVTDLLPTLPLLPECHYFLCGLEAMIGEVSAWLRKRGVPPSAVHGECFCTDGRDAKEEVTAQGPLRRKQSTH